MFKRILLIILFLLVVIGLALLLYFVFFKPPTIAPPEVKPPEVEVPTAKLPMTKEVWERMTIEERAKAGLPLYEWPEEKPPVVAPPVEKPVIPEISEVAVGGKTWINPVSTDLTQDAVLASDGQSSFYYNRTEGKFYQIDKDGNKRLLSEQTFYNVDKVNWSPTKDKAILEYPDGFKTMYDFQKQKQYTLPKNWQDFSWNPNGQQIAFKSISKYPENTWLAIARPDGTEARPIEHMGENADKVTVSWSPNNQVIAFSATGQPRGIWQQEILLIGQHSENFKSLVVDGRGFEPQWSPIGDKIAYSVYNAESGYRPTLYLVNAQGDEIGTNHINTGLNTWAHKCTFNSSGNSLYCAVPRSIPEGAGMLPDLARNLQDDFYRIDVRTGEISFLAEGAMGGYDVERMYLSSDESLLYFVDKYTGRLRYIRLK
ncbi:MAG: TolB family protein [Patescibacteria group bacterium]